MGHLYDIEPSQPVPHLPECIKTWHWQEAAREIVDRHDYRTTVTYRISPEMASELADMVITIGPYKTAT